MTGREKSGRPLRRPHNLSDLVISLAAAVLGIGFILLVAFQDQLGLDVPAPVSYTHLTLPTNREV